DRTRAGAQIASRAKSRPKIKKGGQHEMTVDNDGVKFIDQTGSSAARLELCEPVVIKRERIEKEIERLAALPAPENGRRISLVSNPATGIGNGLTNGIGVSICVLGPHEKTQPIRHNSSQVNFCIRGAGRAMIDGNQIDYKQYDVFTTPPWAIYQHFND